MEIIQSKTQYDAATQEVKPSIMIFSAEWCGDCRFLDRFIDDVVTKYESQVSFYKVDRDAHPEICDALEILGIPSLVAYHNGEVVTRLVNGKRKLQIEIEGFVDDVIAKTQA